jgi:hypothetical protein
MNRFSVLLGLSLSLTLFTLTASAKPTAEDNQVSQTILKGKTEIALKIEIKMVDELAGTDIKSLNRFYVDWNTLNCFAARQSYVQPGSVGTCNVEASSDEADGTFAIIVGRNGITAETLFVDSGF